MGNDVRYQPNGNNRVLRHVLRQVWELRCYWCRNFKDYLDLEIDHILPQDSGEPERARLKRAFRLPAEYDIHALYNLAPICSDCNKLKKGEDLTEIPAVTSKLRLAQRYADVVAKRVLSFGSTSRLGEALLLAAEVDLTDADTRTTFEEGAPAILHRLAELGKGKADYYIHREVTVEIGDNWHSIFVSLNEQGRAAVEVLENIVGGTLEVVLKDPIENLFCQAENATADAFREHDEGMGTPDVGTVDIDWPTTSISTVRYSAVGPGQIEFEFEGSLEASATAPIARSSADGDGLEDVQGDAAITCGFEFDLGWALDEHGAGTFFFDEVQLEDFDADTTVDGRGSRVMLDGPIDEYDGEENGSEGD